MEERLHKFAAIVDAGSYTAAARDLHISQPALSAALAKLERELGAELIVKNVRPLTLTPAGRLAYVAAKEIAARTAGLRTGLHELAEAELHVAIGMIDSVAASMFAEGAFATLAERKLHASIVVDNSRNLLLAVERGDLDMAFIVDRPAATGRLVRVVSIGAEPLVVVCRRNQLVHVMPELVHGRLPNFISYDQASTTAQLVAAKLAAWRITPEVGLYSTSPEVMLRTVLAGRGVAALPYPMVASYIVSGELEPLGQEAPWIISRPIAQIKRRDRELHTALTGLSRQTRQVLASQTAAAHSLQQYLSAEP
jgi:DNA-binding transcriptional LysR family regulator